MSVDPLAAYLAIFMMAAITLGTRLGGAYLMRFVKPSPRVIQFLEAMSASVLAAIVTTYLVNHGTREMAAVATALLLVWLTKSTALALLGGAMVAAGWSAVVSGF